VTEIDFVGGKDVAIVSSGDARPHYGDPNFWEVKVDRNALFIRPDDDQPPIGGGRFTNIAITLVDGRRFQIHAQEVSLEKHGKPDLKLIAELDDPGDRKPEFIRMDEHESQLTGLQAENSVLRKACEQPKPTETALRSPEVDTLNDLHFFDYEVFDVKGKGKNLHSVLFHNDRFTFAAIDGLELPTISALREGNKYVKVQATWVRNRWEMPLVDEGMVQVGKDSFKFRLRGKKQ
jgi:hypothetical protein